LILISRDGQRLRVFQNKVLTKTFGHERKEIIGGWRKLHNGELHDVDILLG
jgi:hypothetical protein